jgi:hypothetical protein
MTHTKALQDHLGSLINPHAPTTIGYGAKAGAFAVVDWQSAWGAASHPARCSPVWMQEQNHCAVGFPFLASR